MTNSRTLIIFSIAAFACLALSSCHAKDVAGQQQQQQVPQQPHHQTLVGSSAVRPTKARNSRSLSDMFEKVKSKIFGSRKQAAASASASASNSVSQVQPMASANIAQRQPWIDLSAFNQQYNPYSPLSGSSYQWPTAGSSNNQYVNSQQYPSSFSSYPGLSSSGSSQSGVGSSPVNGYDSTNYNNPSNSGGLLSSASHLIAQYLSPSGGASSSSNNQNQANSNGQMQASQSGGQLQQQQQQQQLNLSPQQQQQQNQYNEFASILDSLAAQAGATSQRQPGQNAFLGNSGPSAPGPQGPGGPQQGYQQAPSGANMMSSGPMVGEPDMAGSSNIQSYLPASGSSPAVSGSAGPVQQASQKSSMVGLAEQLAPGAQFNKLVSFPFSLTNNDDPNKEGRYKLHIPFLNQHVKRSDQQASASANANSAAVAASKLHQLQQQYTNSYYNQMQQQYVNQQPVAQASQVVPTIVSPQPSPVAPISASSQPLIPQSSSSSSVVPASSLIPQPALNSAPQNSPNQSIGSSSSAVNQQQNSRPAWSSADMHQSSSSSSKLIPMPSAASSSSSSSGSSSSSIESSASHSQS